MSSPRPTPRVVPCSFAVTAALLFAAKVAAPAFSVALTTNAPAGRALLQSDGVRRRRQEGKGEGVPMEKAFAARPALLTCDAQRNSGPVAHGRQAGINEIDTEVVGVVFAWICAALYLGSRVPQIIKNVRAPPPSPPAVSTTWGPLFARPHQGRPCLETHAH